MKIDGGLVGCVLYSSRSFGALLQRGENEFDDTNFPNLSKLAFEINFYKGWGAVQLGIVSPSTIKFNPSSPVVKDGSLMDKDTVKVTWGGTIGFSFIDGWISIGVGGLLYKKSSFTDSYQGNHYDGFGFFNLQSVSLIKSTIKAIQSIGHEGQKSTDSK